MSIIIKNPINKGTNHSTMQDWLNTTREMKLTAYDPSLQSITQLIEPDPAVNLPRAERERMNRSKPGVRTPPEQF